MKTAVFMALLMLCPSSALLWAQPSSAELSPYERQRYGSSLSEVPRDPYRREYRSEEYQARPYIPPAPEPAVRAGASGRRKSSVSRRPAAVRPGGVTRPDARTKDRYQTRTNWRNEQNKISERSRIPAPGPLFVPGSPESLGVPGAQTPVWQNRKK